MKGEFFTYCLQSCFNLDSRNSFSLQCNMMMMLFMFRNLNTIHNCEYNGEEKKKIGKRPWSANDCLLFIMLA